MRTRATRASAAPDGCSIVPTKYSLAGIAALLLLNLLTHHAAQGVEDQALDPQARLVQPSNEGNYEEAKRLAERLVLEAERRVSLSKTNQAANLGTLAKALANLGDIHYTLCEYPKAEQLLRRALEIQESLSGAKPVDIVRARLNLASVYSASGDPQKAEPLLRRAQQLCDKAFGQEHELTALTLNNLGAHYHRLREYGRAETLYQQALEIREKLLGSDHPATLLSIENLASIYLATGDVAKAISLTRRALVVNGSTRETDPEHVADSMKALADIYLDDYKTDKALPLLERALEIREEELGPEHRETVEILSDLASAYLVAKNFSKAAELSERVLKIAEQRLGPDHQDTGTYMNNLALMYLVIGKQSEALELTRRSADVSMQHLRKILSFTSEQQRLAFISQMRPWTQFGTVGSAPDMARMVLRLKGVVLDSILEDRLVSESSRDPAQRELVQKLRNGKQRLMELSLKVPNDASADALRQLRSERKILESETEELEWTLTSQITGLGATRRALDVTVEQVQAVPPAKAALVEYIVHDHYVGGRTVEGRFGAVVICKNGGPRWVSLSSRSFIERKIALFQRAVRGETDTASLNLALASLHKRVWADVEKALPADTETVIISPDGGLNFLSFATLLTPENRFLAEKYSFRYVASGRDLLRKVEPAPELRMTVYADPDFVSRSAEQVENSPKPKSQPQQTVVKRDFEKLELSPLPGTAEESRALEAQARKAGWLVKTYRGKTATESELRKIQSPRILHLATHGFFLPVHTTQMMTQDEGQRGIGGMRPSVEPELTATVGLSGNVPKQIALENPMHRSGLAFAGAQATLRAWARGQVPPTETDGIMSALEVGGLDLKNTWLVTLSACDTGSGEATTGEGVMGLRRGFMQAGAQNLLMTLWSVADEETASLMVDFYEAAESSNNAPKALADTQRAWLVRLRKERGLQTAVTIAGPFIMNLQGPLQ